MVWVLSLSDKDLSTLALTAGHIFQHSEFIRIW